MKLGPFDLQECHVGDCRELLAQLPDQCIQTVVTSPPYWGLRDYGVDGQFGLEPTPAEYVASMVDVFRQVRRVLRDDGTLWLNLGDCYAQSGVHKTLESARRSSNLKINKETSCAGQFAMKHARATPAGLKPKDLVGIPWRVAFALQADGWYLRSDIIWHKPSPMPESVTDRPTKAHEYIFLMSKSARYYYDADSIAEQCQNPGHVYPKHDEPGKLCVGYDGHRTRVGLHGGTVNGETRNRRTVWTVNSVPYAGAHFATFPPKLIEPCILAGSRPGDVVLDPFFGSGTTGEVAEKHGRQWLGFDISAEYEQLARARTAQRSLPGVATR